MSHEDLDIFVRWERFLLWLFTTTEKFPKRVRFTFSGRIDNLALDVLEKIIEAAYSRRKKELLVRVNLDIEKLRVLLRICHRQRFVSDKSFEYAVRELHEMGKMVGGWLKQQEQK